MVSWFQDKCTPFKSGNIVWHYCVRVSCSLKEEVSVGKTARGRKSSLFSEKVNSQFNSLSLPLHYTLFLTSIQCISLFNVFIFLLCEKYTFWVFLAQYKLIVQTNWEKGAKLHLLRPSNILFYLKLVINWIGINNFCIYILRSIVMRRM